MGTHRRGQRRGSDVTIPKTGVQGLRQLEARVKAPALHWQRHTKGKPEPRGTRIRKYGLTPEEELAKYAPEGTTPERILFGWLKTHGYLFTFQEPVMGGRAPGGAVLDFVIWDKTPPLAIRVQSYWHKSVAQQVHDDAQKAMLLELGYEVEDVWEYEVNTVEKVDKKMRELLYGAPKMGSVAPMTGGGCPYCDDPHCTRVSLEG